MKRLAVLSIAAATALAVPAASDAAPNGKWKGHLYGFGSYKKVDQTGSVKFKVRRHKKVVKFRYVDKNYHCINSIFTPSDDTFEYAAGGFKSARIKHGKLHKVVKTGAAKITVDGKFKGKVAKGKIDVTSYSAGCSKNWYWKARLRG